MRWQHGTLHLLTAVAFMLLFQATPLEIGKSLLCPTWGLTQTLTCWHYLVCAALPFMICANTVLELAHKGSATIPAFSSHK